VVALYITSPVKGSGKTALCCGLGKHFLDQGKKVGFLKPAATADSVDQDARLMKEVLALEEPVEVLCPVFSDQTNLESRIKEAYGKVSQGKDVVLIEGILEKKMAETLAAKVIIVEGYSRDFSGVPNSYKDFGKSLLGVTLNKVPASRLERIRSEATTRFNQAGMNILGILPEARSLLTLSIGELAGQIRGEFLMGADKSSELIGNIMLGPKSLDSGLYYFRRKDNKAVIIESERPDMQLAALGTSIKCLVIIGERPSPVVLNLAEDKEVPVIMAKGEMANIVTSVEEALSQAKFNRQKLPRLVEIMEQHFSLKELDKTLGFK